MLGVMCHVSHVRCHVSGVRCQVSNIIIISFVYKVVELVGGGSVINGAYPSSLEGFKHTQKDQRASRSSGLGDNGTDRGWSRCSV